ncbi:hypothetical protein B296_00052324 [Ensete ventricosum]|uniref:WRKY domain-containing protein n=1 Tax=Ensete ventricosum TaxID=4639 RepID=A0A426XFE2_ENSVE|nr:hypothetical protein B296_00052324 [Ensete ventricosum]
MENDGTSSELRSTLMAELARALELVSELQSHLDHPSAAELCKFLATEILSSIGKSILMAKSGDPDGELQAGDSPRSENSSPAFRDPGRRDLMKKRCAFDSLFSKSSDFSVTRSCSDVDSAWVVAGRRCTSGRTKRISWEPSIRGQDSNPAAAKFEIHDKLLLCSHRHPCVYVRACSSSCRAYYRCTHRSSQGCQATKQVQRSDEDPLVFDVTYLGTHTCLQRPQKTPTSACLGHQSSYTLEMEGVHYEEEARLLTSLSFGSMAVMGDTTADLFSSLSSPPAFSSPYQISSFDGGMKLQTSDSDIAELISRGDSASNSSLVDMASMLQEMDFAHNFQFDAPGFDSCSFFP